MASETKIPRIVGKPRGWTPLTELHHFMACPACGGMFDMRRLDQVFEHLHGGPDAVGIDVIRNLNAKPPREGMDF